MCGIIGYVGRREAAPILVDGLRRLEYRGYDSAGVAIQNGSGMAVVKLAGRVQGLAEHLEREPVHGTSGIAHTRWATHGVPSERNAHPHGDCHARVALVHNGIVENADALRVALEAAGHRFITETDTETLAHLIEDAAGDTLEDRVIAALAHVEGTYGLAVMSTDEPGKIVVARRGSPVLLGIGEEELFVASDASAVLEHTRSVVYLDDGDIAVLTADGYHVVDAESHVQLREVDDVAWDLAEIELGGYPHFMLKEISEQAETVRATLRGRLLQDRGTARLNGLNLAPADCPELQRVVILACGTSGHARLGGPASDRRPRRPARPGGVRVRVPLPPAAPAAGHADHRDLAVGRNGGHAGGDARGPRCGIARGGDRQRGGEHDRARGGRGHLSACRPRDRRGVDQGLHLPDRGAGALGALSGTRAGPERGAGSRAGGPVDQIGRD